LFWLEQARGRWRLLQLMVYVVILAVAGVHLWRLMSLRGLPDIGDPFDAAAFRRSAEIPKTAMRLCFTGKRLRDSSLIGFLQRHNLVAPALCSIGPKRTKSFASGSLQTAPRFTCGLPARGVSTVLRCRRKR
jgi:hypothetical protein